MDGSTINAVRRFVSWIIRRNRPRNEAEAAILRVARQRGTIAAIRYAIAFLCGPDAVATSIGAAGESIENYRISRDGLS